MTGAEPGALRAVWASIVLVLTTCGAQIGCAPSGAESRPNILLVVLDTVRQQNVSTYGHARPTTPSIDALASEGVVYENAFAIAPWTTPNHAAMFTGLYTCQHGATQETKWLADSRTTLAELLSSDGYRTASFVNNPAAGSQRGLTQGFGDNFDLWRSDVRSRYTPIQTSAAAESQATHRAIEAWLEAAPAGDPFFIFVNYLGAHAPYAPPRRLLWDDVAAAAPFRDRVVKYDYVDYLTGAYALSEQEFSQAEALYDAEIRYLDEHVARLVQLLSDRGVLDETLIVITSDHGEQFGEHGLVGHQFSLYDAVLRVPLILRLPGQFDGGRAVSAPVLLLDLFPTLLEVAGSEVPKALTIEGRSLASRPAASSPPARDVYAEYYRPLKHLGAMAERYPEFDASPFDRRLRSLRQGTLKFIWSSDGRNELYDLARDPRENANLAAERPALAKQMERQLLQWFESKRAPDLNAQGDRVEDAETRRALEALGYVQ